MADQDPVPCVICSETALLGDCLLFHGKPMCSRCSNEVMEQEHFKRSGSYLFRRNPPVYVPAYEQRAKKNRIRRLKKSRQNGTHSDAEWELLQALTGHRCVHCGSKDSLTKDHVRPLSATHSSDAIWNIQPLCLSCNVVKGVSINDYVPTWVRQFMARGWSCVG